MLDEVPALNIPQKVIVCAPQIEVTDFEFIEEYKEPFIPFFPEVRITECITDNKNQKNRRYLNLF